MNTLKKSPNRTNLRLTVLSAALLSLMSATSVQADGITESIENALKFGQADAKYGQIKVNLNFRYDNTDSKNPALQVANAATLRTRIGYLTPEFHGLQGFAEYEGNQDIVANDYNSIRNGKPQFEVTPDPQEHELNQLWISYKGVPDTEIKVGRQRIDLDNQRFISAVDWRQMQQTYDALLVTNTSFPNTTIKLGYINKIQNINSLMKGAQIPFANITYNFKDIGNLTSYAYLMDFNEPLGSLGGLTHADSNQTYGIRLDGTRKITDDLKAHYLVEYAYQKEHTQNPQTYHASYYHVVGGATAFGVTAKAGMEQLDGKGENKTFDTPLALLHGFNGWADQFLVTPDNGLRDVYGSISGEVMSVKLIGTYHEYTDDTGSDDFGREWNFMATKEFAKHYTLLAKYAYYDVGTSTAKNSLPAANPFSALGRFDTQKFWIGANVSF